MKKLFSLLLSGSSIFYLHSQVYKDTTASVEDRVESILSNMTMAEKLYYIGGINSMDIKSIPRLGLPLIVMSDGPVGVRSYGNTTAYPAGISNAATWDKDLVYKLGQALGRDARARGVHILLAPGLNIYRAPLCGRNFEYFGEDPYLSGQMAEFYVLGVQSKRVVATVKHFAGNNQEWDRNNVSSNIDERTLNEIYLPAFKAGVQLGKAGAVMNAYNLLNGIHCTQNKHLNNDILKGKWGFDGILMSDWGATHDAIAAALGGLDLEMPSGDYMNQTNLLPAINGGTIPQETIDDKVRRILRIIFRFGFYDHPQTDNSIPLDDPENDSVALNLARNGIVLLKNQDSILPLISDSTKILAVVGDNADQYVAGGGSSYTSPFHYVSVLQGIKKLVDTTVTKIKYAGGTPNIFDLAATSVFYTDTSLAEKGLKAQYFSNQNLSGTPAATQTDTIIDFHWTETSPPNISGFPGTNYSIRWSGIIEPTNTDTYDFFVRVDDGCRLWVNNQLIIDHWNDEAATNYQGSISLSTGQKYTIKLEYYQNGGLADITLGWREHSKVFEDAVNAATGADAAIVCIGFNSSLEGEGSDRTFALPLLQDSLINAVASANPNTIVILNAGGNVDMSKWLPNVKALIHAWYPGQEGGTALAEIIFGKTNPSGKLPASFEKKWQDNPVYNNYYDKNGNKIVAYNEGVFVGYRYYDSNTSGVDPLFPFGFGMSYTTFEYSNLTLNLDTTNDSIKCTVTFDITNTGQVNGSEAAQVYVRDLVSSVSRPYKELKGFGKVNLNPGETKTVTVELDKYAFSFFSTTYNNFIIEKGDFEILVGASSKDIRLTGNVTLDNDYVFPEDIKNPIKLAGVDVYPVPSSDYFIINNSTAAKNCEVTIFDMNGRQIDNFNMKEHLKIYNCERLKNGFYFCKITTNDKVFVKNVLIEK